MLFPISNVHDKSNEIPKQGNSVPEKVIQQKLTLLLLTYVAMVTIGIYSYTSRWDILFLKASILRNENTKHPFSFHKHCKAGWRALK